MSAHQLSSTALERFLDQYSEGNLSIAIPRIRKELQEIEALLPLPGSAVSQDLAQSLTDAANTPSRAMILGFVSLAISQLQQLEFGAISPEEIAKVKRVVFHLIQISQSVGHQPSQSSLTLVAKRLIGG